MESYSLANSVYPVYSKGLIDQRVLTENLAAAFYASNYSINQIDEYSSLMCEGDLLLKESLKEFLKDNIANVFQAGIGYALETGITVGTLGTGAPAGIAAEMMNDMVFFGYSAADAISAVKALFTDLGDMKDAIKEMLSSTVKDAPSKIYERVQSTINKLGAFFKKIGVSVEKGLEKLKDLYRNLMSKLAKVTGDMIALISPIPGTDVIVQNGITEFADDAFKTIVKLFDKLPGFVKEYVNNPSKMKESIGSMVDATIAFLKKSYGLGASQTKGLFSKIAGHVKDAATLGPVGVLLKQSGAAQKIIDWLESTAKGLIEASLGAYAKLYPIFMSVASALTIIVNDDHELFKKNKGEKKPVKEELTRNFHTLNNDPYSWKDNVDLDAEVYVNTDGTWQAKITSLSDPEWSSPLRNFKDEYSASAWTEKYIDILTRKQLNKK